MDAVAIIFGTSHQWGESHLIDGLLTLPDFPHSINVLVFLLRKTQSSQFGLQPQSIFLVNSSSFMMRVSAFLASVLSLIPMVASRDLAAVAEMVDDPAASQASVPTVISQIDSPGLNRQSFFETGRPRSEDTLRFRQPPSGVPPVRDNSRSWQFIVFKDGQVSFWMPPGILTNDSVTLNSREGDITFQTLVATDGDYRYIAAYAPELTPEQVANPKAILEAVRDRVAPKEQFTFQGDRAIKLDDHPGIQLTFTSPDTMIVFRTYLVENRVYGLGVVQPKNAPRERAARSFLNALELTE